MRNPVFCVGFNEEVFSIIRQMIKTKVWFIEDFYFSEEYKDQITPFFSIFNSYSIEKEKSIIPKIENSRTVFFMGEVKKNIIMKHLNSYFHRHLDVIFFSSDSLLYVESLFPQKRILKISLEKNIFSFYFSKSWTDLRKRTILEMFDFLEYHINVYS